MKKKGFSLVELIVVLAITSILLGIVIVKSDAYTSIKEKNEAESLLADINYCREQSLASGNTYMFKANAYDIAIINATNINGERKYFKLKYLKANSKYELEFLPAGSAVNAQTIKFVSQNRIYKFIISPIAGRIRVDEK